MLWKVFARETGDLAKLLALTFKEKEEADERKNTDEPLNMMAGPEGKEKN